MLENRDSILNNLHLGSQSITTLAVGGRRPSLFVQNVAGSLKTSPLLLPRYASPSQVRELQKVIKKSDYVLLSLHQIYKQPGIKPGYGKNTIAFIEEMLDNGNVLLVSFRNPYLLSKIKNVEKAKVVLLTYQDNKIIQRIASEVFSGNLAVSGRLPVTINETWQVGDGITFEK